ncbi:energy transducer TonB, partial [bacterium]|nr:energy transducer TonB [candidate division CSSED10-310 bacterium]
EGMLGEATAEETPVDEGMLGEATAEETPVRDSPVDQPPAGEDGTTGETEYYTIQEVDAPARIFTPPSPGNIPLEIINLNLQGEAVFAVFIMPTGEVGRVDVITGTGNTKLDDYVIPMIRKSFWEPAQKDGKAVGFTRNLTLDFFTTACKFDFTDLDQ